MDQRKLKRVIKMLKSLHDKRLSRVLDIVESGPINVTEIRIKYYRMHGKDEGQPFFSHLLTGLKNQGFVEMEKRGKYHYYSATYGKLEQIRGLVDRLHRLT